MWPFGAGHHAMPPHWVADGEPMARSSLIRKVHDARDPSRHGILKSVDGTHEGISKNPGTYMRALREIAVLMAVPPHPYIVPLFDSLVTPEHVHLVIAQAPGKDLALYMKDHDDFMVGESQTRKAVYCLLQALAWIHSRGVVHRDVKADNVVVGDLSSSEPKVSLIDFGFSSFVNSAISPPMYDEDLRPGPGWNSLATLNMVNNGGGLTAEELFYNDIWGAGCIAFTAITGVWAFGADENPVSSARMLHAILQKMGSDHDRWRRYFGEVPVSDECIDFISTVFSAALNHNYPTAAQLLKHPWFASLVGGPLDQTSTYPVDEGNATHPIAPDALCIHGPISSDCKRLTDDLLNFVSPTTSPHSAATDVLLSPITALSISVADNVFTPGVEGIHNVAEGTGRHVRRLSGAVLDAFKIGKPKSGDISVKSGRSGDLAISRGRSGDISVHSHDPDGSGPISPMSPTALSPTAQSPGSPRALSPAREGGEDDFNGHAYSRTKSGDNQMTRKPSLLGRIKKGISGDLTKSSTT